MKEYCKENLLKQIDEAATGLRDYLRECNCNKKLKVIVTARACGPEELEKLIEFTLKTQKKYSCNCTLNVIPRD